MVSRWIDHVPAGDHADRDALTDVPVGGLFACSDHSIIYQWDGDSWETWMAVGLGGALAPTIVDAKGDLLAATAADTVARFPVGVEGQMLVADPGETTGLRWADPLFSAFVLLEVGEDDTDVPGGTPIGTPVFRKA